MAWHTYRLHTLSRAIFKDRRVHNWSGHDLDNIRCQSLTRVCFSYRRTNDSVVVSLKRCSREDATPEKGNECK